MPECAESWLNGLVSRRANGRPGAARAGSDVSAYRRATWFDARREIADKWAAFLLGKQPTVMDTSGRLTGSRGAV